MNKTQLEDELLTLLSEITELDRKVLEENKDAHLFEELKVDSLVALVIISELEKKYAIVIDDTNYNSLVTFEMILCLVEEKCDAGTCTERSP